MKTLVIGAAIVDVIMKINTLPKKGEDIPCTYTVTQVGGCAYNIAKIMALHKESCELFVPIGTGIYANIIQQDLTKNKVTSLIKDNTTDNGYCLSLVESDGERTFVTVTGIEGQFQTQWFDTLNMDEFDNIYLAGYQTLDENGIILSTWLQQQKNKTIFFAPGPVINRISPSVITKIFDCGSIVHLNKMEAFSYTKKDNVEDAAKFIHEKTHNFVIITLGDKGVYVFNNTQGSVINSEKAKVIDTIGAGDSHIATIISKYQQYGILESCRLANKVAAKMVGIRGSNMSNADFSTINFTKEKGDKI